jgi:hypothetical protein
MNRDLLRGTTDPRLRVFVVHEPVLGVARFAPWSRQSGGKDVPKAAQLLQNPQYSALLEPLRRVRPPALASGRTQERRNPAEASAVDELHAEAAYWLCVPTRGAPVETCWLPLVARSGSGLLTISPGFRLPFARLVEDLGRLPLCPLREQVPLEQALRRVTCAKQECRAQNQEQATVHIVNRFKWQALPEDLTEEHNRRIGEQHAGRRARDNGRDLRLVADSIRLSADGLQPRP